MTHHCLSALLGSSLERLERAGSAIKIASGLRWGEGPAYLKVSNSWIFSDIPNDRVLSFSERNGLGIFRSPSNFSNGHFATADGALLCCEHLTRSVCLITQFGERSIIADRFQGKPLNSPNDVVEAPDGTIWFSDPTYGILTDIEGRRAQTEQRHNRVYRYDPTSHALTSEIEDLSMPNGLCFSNEGQFLFVADSGAEMGPEIGFDPQGPRDVFRYAIDRNGRVAGERTHVCRIAVGVPDGMRFDPEGNLWVATGAGLECFSPDGERLGMITAPETASNLAFGGADRDRVLVTTEKAAWLLRL